MFRLVCANSTKQAHSCPIGQEAALIWQRARSGPGILRKDTGPSLARSRSSRSIKLYCKQRGEIKISPFIFFYQGGIIA